MVLFFKFHVDDRYEPPITLNSPDKAAENPTYNVEVNSDENGTFYLVVTRKSSNEVLWV